MQKTLKIPLRGPFQGWGALSEWDYRACGIPRKRGVAGMIGCCMGFRRNSEELKILEESISVKILIERRGEKIVDIQTISPTSKEGRMPTSGGGFRTEDAGMLRIYKEYLTDASFTVLVTAEEKLACEIEAALRDPYWVPFLGRACCLPSVPILPETVTGTGQ